MLGSLILYLKGMRITMFQLSGFYCILLRVWAELSHPTALRLPVLGVRQLRASDPSGLKPSLGGRCAPQSQDLNGGALMLGMGFLYRVP